MAPGSGGSAAGANAAGANAAGANAAGANAAGGSVVDAWDSACGRGSSRRALAESILAERVRRTGRSGWRSAFLKVLARSANVRLSCYAAGVATQSAYRLRARNAVFREAWDTAMEAAIDLLEDEAWRRAFDGVERFVISNGKVVLDEAGRPVMERHYSDMLLERLLRAHRPQKFRQAGPPTDVPTVVKVYSGFDPDEVL